MGRLGDSGRQRRVGPCLPACLLTTQVSRVESIAVVVLSHGGQSVVTPQRCRKASEEILRGIPTSGRMKLFAGSQWMRHLGALQFVRGYPSQEGHVLEAVRGTRVYVR